MNNMSTFHAVDMVSYWGIQLQEKLAYHFIFPFCRAAPVSDVLTMLELSNKVTTLNLFSPKDDSKVHR